MSFLPQTRNLDPSLFNPSVYSITAPNILLVTSLISFFHTHLLVSVFSFQAFVVFFIISLKFFSLGSLTMTRSDDSL